MHFETAWKRSGLKRQQILTRCIPAHGETAAVIPEGIAVIGFGACRCCEKLTEIRLPDSVTAIMPEAFMGCKSLRSIRIPDGVTVLYNFTFARCTALREITVPAALTELTGDVFAGCSGLRRLHIAGQGTVPLPADCAEAVLTRLLYRTPFEAFPLRIPETALIFPMLQYHVLTGSLRAGIWAENQLPALLPAAMHGVISQGSVQALSYLLRHPEWFSAPALREYIMQAAAQTAQGGNPEIQLRLMAFYRSEFPQETDGLVL